MLSKVPGEVSILLGHSLPVSSLVPLGDDQLHMCVHCVHTCTYMYVYMYMYCVYMCTCT